MNKFAKGSLAAGAGLVLLLGGAGTLAYWNDEAELTGGTINAGTLDLEADQTSFKQSELVQWVPGDEHTYATTLTLTTEGDHIQGTVALKEESILRTGDGADEFTVTMAVDEANATIPSDGELEVTGQDIEFWGDGLYEIPVTVTVALPSDATNASQGATIDLSKVEFTATQTAADPSGE